MALPQPKGKQLEVLDLKPEGHNVVLGTAGSGKTTLATQIYFLIFFNSIKIDFLKILISQYFVFISSSIFIYFLTVPLFSPVIRASSDWLILCFS